MSSTVTAVLAVALIVAVAVIVVSLVLKLLRLAVIVTAAAVVLVVGWLVVRHEAGPDVRHAMDRAAAGAVDVGQRAVERATAPQPPATPPPEPEPR